MVSYFFGFVILFTLWWYFILPASNSVFLVLGILSQDTKTKKLLVKTTRILEIIFHFIGFIPFCFFMPWQIYLPFSFGIRFLYLFTVWYCNRKPPKKKKKLKNKKSFSWPEFWPNPVPSPAF